MVMITVILHAGVLKPTVLAVRLALRQYVLAVSILAIGSVVNTLSLSMRQNPGPWPEHNVAVQGYSWTYPNIL
jgi:hypothetical protein